MSLSEKSVFLNVSAYIVGGAKESRYIISRHDVAEHGKLEKFTRVAGTATQYSDVEHVTS
jgi:hypothetical protein